MKSMYAIAILSVFILQATDADEGGICPSKKSQDLSVLAENSPYAHPQEQERETEEYVAYLVSSDRQQQ